MNYKYMLESASRAYAFLTLATPAREHGWILGVIDRHLHFERSAAIGGLEFIDGYCQGWLELDALSRTLSGRESGEL